MEVGVKVRRRKDVSDDLVGQNPKATENGEREIVRVKFPCEVGLFVSLVNVIIANAQKGEEVVVKETTSDGWTPVVARKRTERGQK